MRGLLRRAGTALLLPTCVMSACLTTLPSTDSYALLPESALPGMMRQCSRSTPHATAAWIPSAAQLAEVEKHLSQLSTLAKKQGLPTTIGDSKMSFRQYLGVVVDNHRFIYINAVPRDESQHRDINDHVHDPWIICDGGSAFWGALYDPDTGTFSQLSANGVA